MSDPATDAPWQQTLSSTLYGLVHSKQPSAARLAVARGLTPLVPRDLVAVLCALSCDPLPELHTAAQATLEKLPDSLVAPTVQDANTPPLILATLLPRLVKRPVLLEALVVNRATPDHALALWAAEAPGPQAEMLATDQQRCMRCEPLVRALCQNVELLRSSRDRLFDFLVRAGVLYADMPEVAEAVARLSGTQMQAAVEQIALPAEVASLLGDDPPELPVAQEPAAAIAAARVPMLKRVGAMNMAQKVALATKGNREARAILVRDANRVVAVAAIKNPRITEQEVQAAARSRSVHGEVIRLIANSPEMMRSYGTKVALVQNSKTPLPIAMRLLNGLRAADLKAISKSKGLSQTLVGQAKKLVTSKDSGG